MGNSSSSTQFTEMPADFQLPRQFSVWYKQSMVHITLDIGVDKGSPFAVAHFPGGWYGDLHLCAGPTRDSPRLAKVHTTSLMGKNAAVTMAGDRTEELRALGRFVTEGYAFSCACGPDRQPQQFTWMKADKSQLAAVSSATSGGFKLVRGNGDNANDVVAVWTSTKFSSLTKSGDFEFVGAGATGELGSEFAIMAVCAILKNYQNRNAAWLGASTGSGSAVAASS